MALTTNTDAANVFLLARYLTHGLDDERDPVTDEEARDALAALTDAAHGKLWAGPTGEQVLASFYDWRTAAIERAEALQALVDAAPAIAAGVEPEPEDLVQLRVALAQAQVVLEGVR